LPLPDAHFPVTISLNSRHAPEDYGLAMRGKFQWSFLGIIFAASASFLAATMLIFALAWVKLPAEATN
jgi:hypothetical protein